MPRRALATTLLVAACGIAAAAFFAETNPLFQPWRLLVLWFGAIVLYVAGARALERPDARPRAPDVARWEIFFLTAVTATALLARALAIASLPSNVSGDEGEMGEQARAVLTGEARDPFTTGWLSHPMLWFFLQAASLQTFGNGIFGLRMLSALIGTATIPALYLFARRTFGPRAAAVSAALLATSHLHIHYSRIGLNNVTDPLFMLLALAMFLPGLRQPSPARLASAGVIAGLAQHFYFGSRLIPLVLGTVVVHQLVVAPERVRRASRFLLLALGGFFVAWGPGLRVALFHWNDYTARFAQVGIFQTGWFEDRRAAGESALSILWHQTTQALGAFAWIDDRSGFYGPGMPLLDPVSSGFFALGLLLLLWRWRRPETAAIFAWLLGIVVSGGILVLNVPESTRFVTVLPALCLITALGIVRAAELVAWKAHQLRAAAWAAALVAAFGICIWSLVFYFAEYTPRNSFAGRQAEEATRIARFIRGTAGTTFVYFLGPPWTYYGNGTIRFLADGVPGEDVLHPIRSPSDVPAATAGPTPLYIILPARLKEATALMRRYPHGSLTGVRSRADGEPLFYAFEP